MLDQTKKIGDILRHWRRVRGMSQMDLAIDAGISTKHLSFVENGKSHPSRELILKLAHVFDLSLRDRNAFLLASGFSPEFSEMPLQTDQMCIIHDTLQRILIAHEPYPALVVDATYNILMTNQTFDEIITRYAGSNALEKYSNIYRLMFSEDGMRPWIRNWPTIKNILLARLWGEAVSSQDENLLKIHKELDYHLPAEKKYSHFPESNLPILDLTLQKEASTLRFFSTITTFGTPLDITVQGIRIDCMFPADDETKMAMKTWNN